LEGFYEQIVQRHYGAIFGFLYRFCGRRDMAEDLTQEAFLKLWASPPPALDLDGARRWLLTVARNLAISHFRRPMVARGVDWETCPEPADGAPGPAEAGMANERADHVRRAVAALPRVLREAILLREFEGLDYAAMAEILNVPIGTVRSRLARARSALAERLAGIKEAL